MPQWKSTFSILYPFYRWKSEFKQRGIDVEFVYDHSDKNLRNANATIILSRYFSDGWQSISKRNSKNEEQLIALLTELKTTTDQLVWFDRSDPTGTTDFPIIDHVDSFWKKQILKDINYYAEQHGSKSVRVWLNDETTNSEDFSYTPCPTDQLHKIKAAYNIAYYDHRYFWYKSHVVSNYFPGTPSFNPVKSDRPFDLTFRGMINYDAKNIVSYQRNKVLTILDLLKCNVVKGSYVKRKVFLDELNKSKLCVSPFGWGEICSRDFESMIAGCVLLKPSMAHAQTFPDLFVENKTYIPLNWDLNDLEEKVEYALENYAELADLAKYAQHQFKIVVNSPLVFIDRIAGLLEIR